MPPETPPTVTPPTVTPPAVTPPTGSALGAAAGASVVDWAPERFRVFKDDKSFDLEATARKIAGGYSELNSRLVNGELPPKDADGYKIEDELAGGLKFEDLKKDPKFATRLKGFHAKGMSNGLLKEVLNGFGEFLVSDAELTAEECSTKLRESWKSAQEYDGNMALGLRAATSVASKLGLTFGDVEKAGLGNNPLFIRMMAVLGKEIREDAAPTETLPNFGAPVDEQIAAIDKKLNELPTHAPERVKLLEQKLKLFESKVKAQKAA